MSDSVFPFIAKGLSTKKITQEQADAIFTKEEIEAAEKRFVVKSSGCMWDIISLIEGLVVERLNDDGDITVHGERRMNNPQYAGYEMEGYVSVNNQKRRVMTGSVLFELPNGKLVDCSVLYLYSK